MRKTMKIGICAAAVTGVAGAVAVAVKGVERVRKKWFLRGFDAGRYIGSLTAADRYAHDKTIIQEKYDKLCKDYDELADAYNDMIRFDEDDD